MAECPICMEDGVVLVSMVCHHELCDKCLQKIMVGSKECPFCRVDLNELQENVSCREFYFVLGIMSVGLILYMINLGLNS